jgi:hypothetical protein
VLDEENRDLEPIPDLRDVLHELFGLMGVHAGGGLVQEEELRIGRKGADDLQAALGAVGQAAGGFIRQILHAEDIEELDRPLVLALLLLPVAGETEDTGEHIVADLIMQADADILFHGHLVKKTDILEGTGDAQAGGLNNAHAVQILPVDEHRAGGGLIDFGEKIENGGFSGAVGADQAGDLRFTDGQVEIIDRFQAAELDAEMTGLHDRDLIDVPLGNDGMGRHGDHLCIGAMFP